MSNMETAPARTACPDHLYDAYNVEYIRTDISWFPAP